MEIFLELILTVFLSLIFTSFFVKLVSMQPINTDNDKSRLTAESLKIDKFQWVPFEEETITVEECPNEGKSSVELYNVVGVEMEEYKFKDVVVVDSKESKDGKTEGDLNGGDNDDDEEHEKWFGAGEESEGERKPCEIEIESVEEEEEEEEEKNEIMNGWEEIGRKDFEELLGSKTGLYYVGVEDYGNEIKA